MAAGPYTGRCLASPLSDCPGKVPRRSCSGAGKEEGKKAERRCCRKRCRPGLVDNGANRAHEVFSGCRGRRAHRSRGRGYLNETREGWQAGIAPLLSCNLLVGSRLDRNCGILAGTAGERLQLRHELGCEEIITHRGGDLPLRLPAQAHADLSGGICPFRSAIARWISTAQRNVVHGTDE